MSFKGVFLEGLEVVFIVITFGLNAGSIPLASAGALVALGVIVGVAVLVRKPLSRVPENTIKFAVGLLLTTFGTYWAVEGIGFFAPGRESVAWPGGGWAILVLLAVWGTLSPVAVRLLRRFRGTRALAEDVA